MAAQATMILPIMFGLRRVSKMNFLSHLALENYAQLFQTKEATSIIDSSFNGTKESLDSSLCNEFRIQGPVHTTYRVGHLSNNSSRYKPTM